MANGNGPRHQLRAIRLNSGMTIDELATAAGLHLNTVSKIERGASPGLLETWESLSITLGVSLRELLNGHIPGLCQGRPPHTPVKAARAAGPPHGGSCSGCRRSNALVFELERTVNRQEARIAWLEDVIRRAGCELHRMDDDAARGESDE